LRLPLIGTALAFAGPDHAARLARSLVGSEFVNLELHGVDLLDSSDGLDVLAPHQPDVRVPVSRKSASLVAAIDELQKAGYAFVCLAEAARYFGARLPRSA
jgi:peptidoglycan-N-acetylglucosamine deacetylase